MPLYSSSKHSSEFTHTQEAITSLSNPVSDHSRNALVDKMKDRLAITH